MNQTSKNRLLIVDDEESFLEPFSYWLKSKGYEVLIATSGLEMLELMTQQKVDLVLVDIAMQPMDGYECLTRLKNKDSQLPVILFTAIQHPSKETKAVQLGADAFFYKGIDFTEVDKIIQDTLRKTE